MSYKTVNSNNEGWFFGENKPIILHLPKLTLPRSELKKYLPYDTNGRHGFLVYNASRATHQYCVLIEDARKFAKDLLKLAECKFSASKENISGIYDSRTKLLVEEYSA